MKPSKSVNSLNTQGQQQMMNGHQSHSKRAPPEQPKNSQQPASSGASAPTSPICRCRVMYLGSSVPHITKDGLQGIQEPLRELYPDKASLSQGNAGIDSWLSVWSNGILIENVDETGRDVKRFFKIEALHYCAAVKFVSEAHHHQKPATMSGTATLPHNFGANLAALPKFLPLDSPHARNQQDSGTNPPIFASILRRTTGVKVLECHAFICKREAAANALVRCCFHAYADTMYAKQIGAEISDGTVQSARAGANSLLDHQRNGDARQQAPAIAARRSKSIAALNDVTDNDMTSGGEYSDSAHQHQRQDNFQNAALRRRSLNNGQTQLNYANGSNNDNSGDMSDASARQRGYNSSNSLQSQKYSSKSMHQLNLAHLDQSFGNLVQQDGARLQNGAQSQSTSYRNLAAGDKFDPAEPSPFLPHNPYASRVPSYPPQNIIDQQQQQLAQGLNGGTLRSVRSMAANSIASTLLRSKKHAKAMSMAQLSLQQQKQQQQQQQPITSFHQLPSHQAPDGSLYGGTFMTLPPVPAMFLPNVARHMNGSQTMKLPSRHPPPFPMMGAPPLPINAFEAMTPKEMKKLLKKSAKYGIDASRFAENGLPLLPLPPMPLPQMTQQGSMFGLDAGGTFNSTGPMYSMGARDEFPHDLANPFGPPLPMFLPPPPPDHLLDPSAPPPQQPIKSILVKPNPEFLKSKAGKKWLKQQKEFKKLLPSHLDGLPIVFGPPPMDMMEPAGGTNGAPAQLNQSSSASSTSSSLPPQRPPFMQAPPPSHLPPPPPGHGQLPILDSSGFYNPHPLYRPSGRASAASTLMRNSPQVMQPHHLQPNHQQQLPDDQLLDQHHHQMMMQQQQQRNSQHQSMYSNPILMSGQQSYPPPPPPPPMLPPHLRACDDLYGARLHPASHSTGPYERQFVGATTNSSTRSRRNHMVEQSVISLEDEENEDDDEGDARSQRDDLTMPEELCHESEGNQQHDQVTEDQSSNGYYDRLEGNESESARHRHRRRRRSSSHEQQQQQHQMAGNYQDDYEQINTKQMANEDRNSNSSGIYRRRGHINERAFSYSIRQEASKSSADNSDAEYRNDDSSNSNYQSSNGNNNNHNNTNYRLSQQQMHHNNNRAHYDNPLQQGNVYQDRHQIQYYKQQPPQQQPVDVLSARLESQLNMKSFSNSCVKSHM